MQASAALAERVRREELCAVTASSCRRLLLSLRLPRLARPPTQSAALGPAEPGRLSGRRRLSATLESRGARRPGTSGTPRTPLCPVPPPPPHCRGDAPAAPPGPQFSSSSSPRGRSGESRAAAPGGSEPRPLSPRLGAGGGGGGKCASLPGGEFHLQAEAATAVASCVKAAAAAARGAGARGAPWPWRGDPDSGTPTARLCLFGPLSRYLN